MFKLRYIFIIFVAVFFVTNLEASLITHKEEADGPVLRKLDLSISPEQYDKFEEAKASFHTMLGGLPEVPGDNFFLFKASSHKEEDVLYILGSFHDMPFEFIPSWFSAFMEREIQEVYLESELVSLCRYIKKDSSCLRTKLGEALYRKVSLLLDPIFQIFSCTIEDASLEDAFVLVMCYEALLGTDSTLSLLSRKQGKDVYLLDAEIDAVQTDLNIYKASIARQIEDEEGISPEVKKAYLDDNSKALMRAFIEEEVNSFCAIPSSEATEGFEDWRLDFGRCDEEAYLTELRAEPAYADSNVEVRNERWFNLLTARPASKKLICVGLGHLPDFLHRFKMADYEIERYTGP